jgi:hypothetical protein
MDNRRISFCCPTYNREGVLLESFAQIGDDERVQFIHLSDDESELELFNRVISRLNKLPYIDKISITRNLHNRDCFVNKRNAVIGQKDKITDWVILGDSDNIFGVDYLDAIYSIKNWEEDTIYTPEFAAPNFDFRAYAGLVITKENVAQYIDLPMFETMCNANNFFLNRNSYLSLDIWEKGYDPITSDSIYVCLKWLEAGNKIKIVEGLTYFHRVWEQSHYRTNISRTPFGLHQNILNQLRNLK